MGLKGDGGAKRHALSSRVAPDGEPLSAPRGAEQVANTPLWSKTDHGFSLALIAVAVAGI
jgi:hypothetical protein